MLALNAQTFELEKSSPKVVLRFREIVPDTLTGSLLYDGKLISGKVVRHRYKCTFDYNEQHEGEIFYTLPTAYFDKENKALDASKVIGWNLPGNNFASIGSPCNMWCLYSNNLNISTSTLASATLANDLAPVPASIDDFLENGDTIEISEQ